MRSTLLLSILVVTGLALVYESIFVGTAGESGVTGSAVQALSGTVSVASGGAESHKLPANAGTDANSDQPVSATSALNALASGNLRFVEGRSIHPHESASYRASLANGQHPFATVLACSDSRVTPVLIFDQGIGDLFVIRVAGNIVDDDVAGSIEYAVDHLGTRLLVVMGHENCGAVTAAYHSFVARDLGAREPHEIESLLHRIEPALGNIDRSGSVDEQIAQGVEENVREAIRQLSRIPDLRHALEEDRVRIVGAIYSLRTGEVRFLDE